jgi:hypothetical protein
MRTGRIRSAIELHIYPRLNRAAEAVLHKLGKADDFVQDKYREYKTEIKDLYTGVRIVLMQYRVREAGFSDVNEARAAVLLLRGIPDLRLVHLLGKIEKNEYAFQAVRIIRGGKINGSNIRYGYLSLIFALKQIGSYNKFMIENPNNYEIELIKRAKDDRVIYQTEGLKDTNVWIVSSDPLRTTRKKANDGLSKSDQFALFNLGARVLLGVPRGA